MSQVTDQSLDSDVEPLTKACTLYRRLSSASTRCSDDSPSLTRTTSKESTYTGHDGMSTEQTIIIFDWDDTLCPSSWIRANAPTLSYFQPPPKLECFNRPLRELEDAVIAVLTLAQSLGTVIIITNASQNWVNMSCKNYLPRAFPLVSSIPVVYAQTLWKVCADPNHPLSRVANLSPRYVDRAHAMEAEIFREADDDAYPGEKWKKLAFATELSAFYLKTPTKSWTNVISVGDADDERTATHYVVSNCSPSSEKSRAKTIKMWDAPDVDELIDQLQHIQSSLPALVAHDNNFMVDLD